MGLHKAGHLALVNPDNLNRVQVDAVLKGSKSVMPLIEGSQETARISFESLHFKLSVARWINSINVQVQYQFKLLDEYYKRLKQVVE